MSQLTSTFSKPKRNANAPVSEDRLLEAARNDTTGQLPVSGVASNCPRFIAATPGKLVTIYEGGKVGDTLAVRHRGEITTTARECEIAPGRVNVKYGFSGRVLLGPKGQPGAFNLPLQVQVVDKGRNVLSTQKVTVAVTVTPESPIGYFSLVRDISFNVAPGARPEDYDVNVAFDKNIPGAG